MLQNVDLGTLLFLTIGGVFLCVIGLLIFFGLQVLGTSLNAIFGFFAALVTGGPVVWCGCLVVIFICIFVVGGALLITTCNADASSINFCLLVPR
jgi:hypothetical protein